MESDSEMKKNDDKEQLSELNYTLMFIGEKGTGKSLLINKFVNLKDNNKKDNNEEDNNKIYPTFGVDYKEIKSFEFDKTKQKVDLRFIDIQGGENELDLFLGFEFLEEVDAIIIVFNLSDENSLEMGINLWNDFTKEILKLEREKNKKNLKSSIKFFLIGNIFDENKSKRDIPFHYTEKFDGYFKINAKKGGEEKDESEFKKILKNIINKFEPIQKKQSIKINEYIDENSELKSENIDKIDDIEINDNNDDFEKSLMDSSEKEKLYDEKCNIF